MKKYELCGLGNALVDVLVDISQNEFDLLSLEKSTMRLVSSAEQSELLSKVDSHNARLVSGGSVGNSIILFAQLGGKAVLQCCTGDDRFGTFYRDEAKKFGIYVPNAPLSDIISGTCLVLVTPDAERTMRTCLGAAEELHPELLNPEAIADSEWFFVEGYVLANPEPGRQAVKAAVEVAKKSGTKVAITCSEPWVVTSFGADLNWVLEKADLVFTNEHEAAALTGSDDPKLNCEKLANKVANVVVTCGAKGAYVFWNGKLEHVPAFPTEPRDLTGAGDALAGTFLYGVTHGLSARESLERANYMAHLVISQVGARLTSDVKTLWNNSPKINK